MEKGNLEGIVKDFGGWRLSKWISILTFPGFLAALGFWILRDGFYVSNDVLRSDVVLTYVHSSSALFGYVLVPLLFVFVLRYGGAISSIEMPLLKDRRLGYLGAVAGSLMVVVNTHWDAQERAGRTLKYVESVLGDEQAGKLKDALSHAQTPIDEAMCLIVNELQRYSLVVFLGLLFMYGAVFFGRKLSIHLCGVTTFVSILWVSLYRLYDKIPLKEIGGKVFAMPFAGWGDDWQKYLTTTVLGYGLALISVVYWARWKEEAHSHGELFGGMAVGLMVTVLGAFL
jgi:hypothetical protein